jgi:hypothetical protein
LSCCVPATGIRTELPLAHLRPAVGEQSRQAPPKLRAGRERPSRSDSLIRNQDRVRARRDGPQAAASKCIRTVTACHRRVTECNPPVAASHVAAIHPSLASDMQCLCRAEPDRGDRSRVCRKCPSQAPPNERPGSSPRQSKDSPLDISGRKVAGLHSGSSDVWNLAPGVFFVPETQARAVPKVVTARRNYEETHDAGALPAGAGAGNL